jgi:hypothetical protein
MGKEYNIMETGIIIRENLLMACPKDMDNIFGQKEVHIKAILNRVREMDMGYGRLAKIVYNATKGIFQMIKRQDMEFINGTTDGCTKEILIMIIETDTVSFIILRAH